MLAGDNQLPWPTSWLLCLTISSRYEEPPKGYKRILPHLKERRFSDIARAGKPGEQPISRVS
jgi:hypothetical protein